MKTPYRVIWSEGLLMTPHHLQQQDLYHEGYVDARLEAIEPLSWGVLKFSVDPRGLQAGQVALTELEAILPGGLPLSLDAAGGELPPSRLVEGHFPHHQSSLDVYVGVPRERVGANNYGQSANDRTRFLTTPRSFLDTAGSAGPQEVLVARRNVALLFGDEPREDYDAFKLLELVRDNVGSLTISDPYIAPSLRISASPFLMAGLRRLLSNMSNRRKALVESQRERGDAAIEYNASDVSRYLLLQAINTYLPVLSHLVDVGDVHPRAAYLLLVQFAGQLSAFASRIDPGNLPKFAYTDLRETFEALFAVINSALHLSVREHFVSARLEVRSDGMHYGKLTDERFGSCKRFFLAVRSALDPQAAASQLPRLAKVASFDDIATILAAAAPGAPVEVTFRPPPEIPIKAGTVYFSVSTANDYWQRAFAQREIAVFLPAPFQPNETQVEVVGLPSGA